MGCPRTGSAVQDVHVTLGSEPEYGPPSAKPRSQLCMATCPGQRMVEATHGNGYAPVQGMPMMMVILYMSK